MLREFVPPHAAQQDAAAALDALEQAFLSSQVVSKIKKQAFNDVDMSRCVAPVHNGPIHVH